MDYLDFEQPLADIADQIEQLKSAADNPESPTVADKVQDLRKQLTDLSLIHI